MNNRLFINLLLLLIIIALTLVAWIKPGKDSPKVASLTSLDTSAIDSITIERKQAKTIHLTRTKGQWALSQPIQAPALTGKIERLLKISQIKPPVIYPLKIASLQQFGLDKPVVRLHFNNTVLSIGSTESVNLRRYVSDETQLYLLDDTFLHLLAAPVDSYIDTRLLVDNIQLIGLQTPTINLQRNTDNTWTNKQQPSKSLSSDVVQMLLDEWRFARAMSVSSQAQHTNGEKITLTINDGKELMFQLNKQKNNVVLTSHKTQLSYTFSNDKYKKMTTLTAVETPDA
ncbi:MAG: hypothetical protein COB22_05310 [Cycloclasticus sp.]|nr:MAG: hypothetical protein COB22_05310 [Cycloclasticus sp.]